MPRRRVPAVSVVCAALLGGTIATRADTQTVTAQFEVRFGPLQVGRGNFEAQIGRNSYAIGVAARVSGVARLFVGGEGTASAQGSYSGNRIVAETYQINNTVGDGTNAIRIGLRGGAVASESVQPPVIPLPDRVPVHDTHRRGVVDPLSAFLIAVEGSGDMVQASSCNRTARIYDGRARYDIVLSYGRTEELRVRDYEGPALVCKASYSPVAGHRRSAPGDTNGAPSEMEAWFVPVNGTRMMVLYRLGVSTSSGRLTIQATRIAMTPSERQEAAR